MCERKDTHFLMNMVVSLLLTLVVNKYVSIFWTLHAFSCCQRLLILCFFVSHFVSVTSSTLQLLVSAESYGNILKIEKKKKKGSLLSEQKQFGCKFSTFLLDKKMDMGKIVWHYQGCEFYRLDGKISQRFSRCRNT